MHKYLLAILVISCVTTGLAKADDKTSGINTPQEDYIIEGKAELTDRAGDHEDEYGITNPDELSLNAYITNMKSSLSRGHDFVCALGYWATKEGRHEKAVKIFRTCADHGNQGSKIWMSYMHQNGFGVKKDAKASTDWLKDAADDNYSIGQYNYGLALLKGYGVKRDLNAAKKMIFKAAEQGDTHAKILIDSNFDPDVVTPDADQIDKQPLF